MGIIGRMGEYEHEFGILLDAVLHEPHKVKDIVTKNRDILVATNYCGENVLSWLSLENHLEGVALLRSLGSPIPDFSLWEAMEMGHTDMVILLLELGVEVDIISCRWVIEDKNGLFNLSKKKERLMRSYFKQFGYEI